MTRFFFLALLGLAAATAAHAQEVSLDKLVMLASLPRRPNPGP